MKYRSEEIIRNVIRNKDDILSAAGLYSCNVYIKATQEESSHLFFFQAEDGIRDHCVTGVQTCALPILAQFTEHDGVGELDVSATGALIANFADGGKTIVVTAAPTPPPQVAQELPPPDLHIDRKSVV